MYKSFQVDLKSRLDLNLYLAVNIQLCLSNFSQLFLSLGCVTAVEKIYIETSSVFSDYAVVLMGIGTDKIDIAAKTTLSP